MDILYKKKLRKRCVWKMFIFSSFSKYLQVVQNNGKNPIISRHESHVFKHLIFFINFSYFVHFNKDLRHLNDPIKERQL